MDKIGIIGTGLIGASLGLALKKAGIKNTQIIGVDLERSRANKAKKMGAIDKVGNMMEVASQASVIFIATPVMTMKDVMETIGPRLPEGVLVTDTGSTKREVLEWAKEHIPSNVDFIGAHPLTGKETRGPDGAEAIIFQGRPYCIIPRPGASTQGVRTLTDLVTSIGSKPYFIDVEEHDSFVAAVSHLPFIVSAAIIGCTSKSPQWGDISALASGGFRDVSRLASGDWVMHRDICLTNKDRITHWIDEFILELHRIKEIMQKENNGQEMHSLFEKAFDEREKWLAGVISPWARADYERPGQKVPSFSHNTTSMFFGERLTKKLFGDGDDSNDGKERDL